MFFLMFYVFAFFIAIEATNLKLRPTLDEKGRESTDFKLEIKDNICESCEIIQLIKQNEQEDLKLKYTNILAKVKERVSKRPLYEDKTAVPVQNDKNSYIANGIIDKINDFSKTNIKHKVEEIFNKYYDENRINRIKYDLNRFDNSRSYYIKYNPFNVYSIQNKYNSTFPLKNNNEHRLKRFKVEPSRFDRDRSENKYVINFSDQSKFAPENIQYDVNAYQRIKNNPLNFRNIKLKYDSNEEKDKSKADRIQLNLNQIKDQYENALNELYSKYEESTYDPYNVHDSHNTYDSEDYTYKIKSIIYDPQNKYDKHKVTKNVEEIKSNHNHYNNGIDKHNLYSSFHNKNKNNIQDSNENTINDNKIVLNYDKYHENYADTNSAEDRIGGKNDDYDFYNSNEDYESNIRSFYNDVQDKYNDYENNQNVEEIIKSNLNRYINGIDKNNPYSSYHNKNKNNIFGQDSNENIAFNMDDVNANKIVLNYDKYHENNADNNSADDKIGGKDEDEYNSNEDYEKNIRSLYYDVQNKYSDYEDIRNVEEIIKSNLNRYIIGIKDNPYIDYHNKNNKNILKQDSNENTGFNMDHQNDADINSAEDKIGSKDDDNNYRSIEDNFGGIMRRRSNLGKCCRACNDAYIAGCRYLECSDRAYRCLRKEFSKSCYKYFDEECSNY